MRKPSVKSLLNFVAVIALCGITALQCLTAYEYVYGYQDSLTAGPLKSENYFPIESFVMISQDLWVMSEICDENDTNCLPYFPPTQQIIGTGSGVIVGERDGKSLVLTAGHVCSSPTLRLPMTQQHSAQYRMDLTTGYGHEGVATILSIDMSNDLCLVISDTYLGPPIKVASQAPGLHETVLNMASPLGLAEPLAVPVFSGYYIGQVSSLYMFTFPAAPGSSGSPIMNPDHELISIVSAAAVNFDEYVIGCKTQALRNFLISNDALD